jgi:anti-repressor protein
VSDITPFTFPTTGQSVRTLLVDGDPWFVAADVTAILGYANGRAAVQRHVDEEDRQEYRRSEAVADRYPFDDLRIQSVSLINESGLFSLILRSDVLGAREFKRWVTCEVLPAIRKTGSYSVAEVSRKELARLIIEAEEAREEAENRAAFAEHQVLELAPAAHAWDTLASANGDFSLREAANILNRDPLIQTGQNRLAALLRTWGVLDGHNRPYATHSQHARLRPQTRPDYAADDGSRKPAAPQPRITVQGVRYIHKRLAGRADVNALISEELSEDVAA